MVVTQKTALIERYRSYLDALEWQLEDEPSLTLDEYVDLLSYGEVVDLLTTRDALVAEPLSADERAELRRLDALLERHALIVATNTPPQADTHPRAHWWWHLDPAAAMPRATDRS